MQKKEPLIFRFHFPRGTLSKRMSGLELATFLMPHLPHIVPLMSDMPVCQKALQKLLLNISSTPPNVLDEIYRWIRPVVRCEEDDIIELMPIEPDEEMGIFEKMLTQKGVHIL